MKKILYCLLFLFVHNYAVAQHKAIDMSKLQGTYIETWASTSNVNYSDTVVISFTDNILEMKCLNERHYVYEGMVIKAKKLKFTLINTNDFRIKYTLKASNTYDILDGHIINPLNKKVRVKFEKII